MRLRDLAGIAIAIAVTLAPHHASAASKRWASWFYVTGNSGSPVYPVVRVYLCEGPFNTHFPGFAIDDIANNLRSAMNEWFTGGNADLRLRLVSILPANDPQCLGTQPVSSGTILVTAEKTSGVSPCRDLGRTFLTDPNGLIDTATVILFRGHFKRAGNSCVSTGPTAVYQDWNWAPTGGYPGSGQYDFWTVLLHELGHAIGFHHDCNPPTSIMCPGAPPGLSQKRHLVTAEIASLKFTQGANLTEL